MLKSTLVVALLGLFLFSSTTTFACDCDKKKTHNIAKNTQSKGSKDSKESTDATVEPSSY
jgi:hypothetical protein